MERSYEKGKDEVEERNNKSGEEKNERLLNFITQEPKQRKEEKKKIFHSQTHIQTLTQIEETTVTVFLFTIQHSPYDSRHT